MIYRLVFENQYGNHIEIGRYSSKQEANAVMVKELTRKGVKPYYYRCWKEDNVTHIDYGSYVSFFHMYEEEE